MNGKTVQLWVNRHKVTGGVVRKRGQGRKTMLSSRAAGMAVDMLLGKMPIRRATTQQAARELHRLGHTPTQMHKTTISRHAKAVAAAANTPIQLVRCRPAKQLTASDMAQRLALPRLIWTGNGG